MSDVTIGEFYSEASPATATDPSVGDFIALMKPRVMSLVIFTALTGMVAAPGPLHPLLAAISVLAIAVGAGASGALNMWYDADIDAHMARTAGRPIPRLGLLRQGGVDHGGQRGRNGRVERVERLGRLRHRPSSPGPRDRC